MPDDKPMDRRAFFRQGLRGLITPLEKAIKPVERAAHHLGKLEAPMPAAPPASGAAPPTSSWNPSPKAFNLPVLRPPGALAEAEFLSTCTREGQCVRVCPVSAIRIDPSGRRGGGAPYIDADLAACAVCTGLQCMQTCPTGALVPTPMTQIDIGTARWQAETCSRSHGENCTICIDHCPLGTAAIQIQNGRVQVYENVCIGPKSIVVVPRSVIQGHL
jgi:ferredoxin